MDSRRIVLAVTGGIAAYKAPELVRQLKKAGHEVRCALTRSAAEFVSPLVLQTLSGEPVRQHLFDPGEESEIDHIGLADWAELVIVAPATADLLARMVHGRADDLVTAVLLATRAPVLVAPAMNVHMWSHPATEANVAVLAERGVLRVGPEAGELACGWEGLGRMSPPEAIVAAAEAALTAKSLAGETVIVTAGGTAEPIDAVRSVTNRSTGKMGFAIAEEAAGRGARVLLIVGPTVSLETPSGVERLDVGTAAQMREAVLGQLEASTIVIKAAAVADFRPARAEELKIKKEALAESSGLHLELVATTDILSEVCEQKGDRIVVGFAAESHDVVGAAKRKIERKGCDLLVANDISRTDAGFGTDDNAVLFVRPGGDVEELPLLPKREVAAQLFDRIEKIARERRA